MITQTAILLNLSHYKLHTFSQCRDVTSLVEEVIRIELDRLCDEYECDRNHFTINFNDSPHARDVQFWYWVSVGLNETCIREINESVKQYLRPLVPTFTLQSSTKMSKMNFSVTHNGNGFFMLNYVYFQS